MTSIRTLIIDDEEHGRQALCNLLKEFCPQVELVGMADSAATGLRAILQQQPELVFLDVRMPSSDEGFQLLESLDHINFAVIFTTAYDEYAIRAIKFSALDYLLKPINILELQKAVNRYAQRRGQTDRQGVRNLPSYASDFQKIGLPSLQGLTFVAINDIIRCEADGNCTLFFLADKRKMLVTKTLKYYEQLLFDEGFYRTHGSHLVNLKHIVRYLREGVVYMTDGSAVYVSARKKKGFLAKLQNKQFKI